MTTMRCFFCGENIEDRQALRVSRNPENAIQGPRVVHMVDIKGGNKDDMCHVILGSVTVDDYLGGAASGVANVFVARSGDDGVRCPDVGVRSVGPSMADEGDS
ncbi:hypothetical protein Tco_1097352 [Tanacetum coccineum]